MKRAIILVAALLAHPASTTPRFIPSPKQSFAEFAALNAPRPEVPVGALWVDGYGPTGPGASPDNLETVRSLNGMTIDRNLQLSLTAGLLDLIGVEPRLRNRHTARFTDLSIIRVKDPARLAGPPGEARIVEALKAGSISVTSEGEIGLNARIGIGLGRSEATTSNLRSRADGIEGRDLVIAVRVATFKIVRGPERDVKLRAQGAFLVGRAGDYQIYLKREGCAEASRPQRCSGQRSAAIVRLSSWPAAAPTAFVPLDANASLTLPLPVPLSDGKGGLHDSIILTWLEGCRPGGPPTCKRMDRLSTRLEGRRLDDLKSPDMVRWP